MKIALATIAMAHAAEKKVPPRHPLQRLNKLGVFYDNFAAEMVAEGKMKQGQADRFSARMDSFLQNMEDAFNRPNCGHYDADQGKHGGPDENPEINFNTGKPRNRRDIDEEDLAEATNEFCTERSADNYTNDAGVFNEAVFAECCHFDSAYCNGKMAPRSGAKKAYDRLSNNPELKWKQITTGTRKWAQRYINNCHGQRKFKKASKRANKLYKTWDERLFA
jgi:hypothetical protein